MPHEGGQTDKQHSEAIVPLLSTQHSGTLTSQTSLDTDHDEYVNLLLHLKKQNKKKLHTSTFALYLQCNIRQNNICCSHTPVPCNTEINKNAAVLQAGLCAQWCNTQETHYSPAFNTDKLLYYRFLTYLALSKKNVDWKSKLLNCDLSGNSNTRFSSGRVWTNRPSR